MDTIYALSSGNVPSGVAVVRVSGTEVPTIITESGFGTLMPRRLKMVSIRDRDGYLIDDGMAVYFPGPASFTGDDCLEFQVHGSRAVMASLYEYLGTFDNVRVAEPGEFTRTAFINGKMDLTAAEGLADIIHAETKAQLDLANSASTGKLFALYQGWMDELLEQEAFVTASIDFSDEEDVAELVESTVYPAITRLKIAIEKHVSGYKSCRQIREGFKIAIVGAPNVGKSSLLNMLSGSDRAIVSEVPGTTRDIIEVRMDFNGRLAILADTAGLRETVDPIEAEGIKRSLLAATESDLVMFLADNTASLAGSETVSGTPVIIVQNKVDLADQDGRMEHAGAYISCKTGAGLDGLINLIAQTIEQTVPNEGDFLPIQERHLEYLHLATKELSVASNPNCPLEITAQHIRSAALLIGKIVGRYDVEDVLGAVFSRFCIGK